MIMALERSENFAILKRKTWNASGRQLKVLLYVETP